VQVPQCASIKWTAVQATNMSAVFNATGSTVKGRIFLEQVGTVGWIRWHLHADAAPDGRPSCGRASLLGMFMVTDT
jgi:hypothetical protein